MNGPLTPAAIAGLLVILLSVVAAWIAWRRLPPAPAARSFAWWLTLAACFNLVSLATGLIGMPNHEFFQWYRLFSVLLLGLTASQLLTHSFGRRLIWTVVAAFVVLWVFMTLKVENLDYYSKYTSPAESAVGLLVGLLFVATALRADLASPFHHPGTWLGIGLVLLYGTYLAATPIIGEVGKHSRQSAFLLSIVAQLFDGVAAVIFSMAYLRKSVVWTR